MISGLDGLRGSRGFSVGWTGGQCLKTRKGDTAEPCIAKGTERYQDFIVRLSKLVVHMSLVAGFGQPFQDPETGQGNPYKGRRETYAQKIHPQNVLESVSFRCYIHELDFVKGGSDTLKVHVDKENCPQEGWDGCGVAYQDIFCKHIGRWVTLVAIGTSRKSISNAMARSRMVGRAADLLEEKYHEYPLPRKEILDLTFCPSFYKSDHQVKKIHFHPTVHLSVCLESIRSLQFNSQRASYFPSSW